MSGMGQYSIESSIQCGNLIIPVSNVPVTQFQLSIIKMKRRKCCACCWTFGGDDDDYDQMGHVTMYYNLYLY